MLCKYLFTFDLFKGYVNIFGSVNIQVNGNITLDGGAYLSADGNVCISLTRVIVTSSSPLPLLLIIIVIIVAHASYDTRHQNVIIGVGTRGGTGSGNHS